MLDCGPLQNSAVYEALVSLGRFFSSSLCNPQTPRPVLNRSNSITVPDFHRHQWANCHRHEGPPPVYGAYVRVIGAPQSELPRSSAFTVH